MSAAQQPPSSIAVDAQKVQVVVQLAQAISTTFFNGQGVSAMTVISLAMAAVEKYSTTQNLTSAEKVKLAVDSIPDIINVLVSTGIVNQQTGANLNTTITNMGALVTDFMNTAAFLTNNPGLIQSDAGASSGSSKTCGCF